MNIYKEIYFQIIIILSNILQVVAGFGGNLVAIPFCVGIMGFSDIKMVLNTFSNVGCILLLFWTFKDIDWKEFWKMTLGMLGGMVIGWIIVAKLSVGFLLNFYGIFAITVGVCKLFFKKKVNINKNILNTIVVIAGIIHGMFLSGGCMLVIYASSALKEKKQFRATLNAVWVVIGTLWMGYDYVLGNYTKANIIRSIIGTATLLISIPVGNYLFNQIEQERFQKLVYILIIIAGIILIF